MIIGVGACVHPGKFGALRVAIVALRFPYKSEARKELKQSPFKSTISHLGGKSQE
jgi:hypothetical protein